MSGVARIGLDGGGTLTVEAAGPGADGGPIQAGRVADGLQQMPETLRAALQPITQASRELLAELRSAGPGEVKVEFGVTLTAAAGAMIAKGEAGCHLKVTLTWSGPAA